MNRLESQLRSEVFGRGVRFIKLEKLVAPHTPRDSNKNIQHRYFEIRLMCHGHRGKAWKRSYVYQGCPIITVESKLSLRFHWSPDVTGEGSSG
ncbi:hypothetical protein PM082_007289 [Marasmius tenuissimus]|nr:hypothetical protein PM082_007289 [Marasmius tenuissimus]